MRISKHVRWFAHGSLVALAIYLGSTSLINYALSPPPKAGNKPKARDNAKFRERFKAGDKALRKGQFSEALEDFREAEQSTEQLTDDQYDSLKKSRLQIAQAYESASNNSEAENVYRAMEKTSMRDGQALFLSEQYESAVARAQDAEQFSDHLTEGKGAALQESRTLLANSLGALHRYPEAVEANRRMIDYLRDSGADSMSIGGSYLNLAVTESSASDWPALEQALNLAVESYDKTLATETDQMITGRALISKNWAQYNLVIAYYREGNTDAALSKAEDFFAEASQPQDPMHPVNVAYQPSDFAALALKIATESKRQDAISLWLKRGGGNVNVIALSPTGYR
jgi:tetratricopeptide (TPR) repeat protein